MVLVASIGLNAGGCKARSDEKFATETCSQFYEEVRYAWNRRTDLSQAAVAAALESAAVIAETHQVYQAHVCAARIRALITPSQHDALAAHVAAEVGKARAEDAAKIDAQMRRRIPNRTHDDTFDCGWNAGLHAALAQIGAKP